MKKLISILIAALICFGCVLPAFADMDIPRFKEYEAYIINPDGFSFYDRWDEIDINLPYNSKITITGEYDGVYYFDYNGRTFEIKPEDISKVKSEVDVSEAVTLEHPMTYVVISEEGAKIRKGPAESYDEVGTIPCNTEVTVTYGIKKDTFYMPWAYCTYEGISGWIYVVQYDYNYEFATKLTKYTGRTGKVITLNDENRLLATPGWCNYEIENEEDTSEPEYISDPIPAGTEFTYDIIYEVAKASFAYVEYNGVKGWLCAGEDPNGPYTSVTTDDTISGIYIYEGTADIYSSPYDGGEKLGTIPQNTGVITYLGAYKIVSLADGHDMDYMDCYEEDCEDYTYVHTCYVEYDGVTGWITRSYDYNYKYIGFSGYYSFRFKEETTAYEKDDLSGKTTTISPDKTVYMSSFRFGDNYNCAIITDGKLLFMPYIDEYNEYEDADTEYNIDKDIIETELLGKPLEINYSIVYFEKSEGDEAEESSTEKIAEKDTQKSLNTMIIIIVAVVAVLVVASLVTIILIKKKKAKAEEEVKDDSTESEQ